MEKQRPLWRSLLKPKPELPCTEKESAEPAASISGTMKRKGGGQKEGGRKGEVPSHPTADRGWGG